MLHRSKHATATPGKAHGRRSGHGTPSTEAPKDKNSGLLLFVLLTAAVMAGVAVASLPDIKRYLEIRKM